MKKINGFFDWWLPLVGLCALAYWIQMNLGLHKDVAMILHTANLMLQGQTYAHDIFEPNPPLIFFISALPVLFAKMTGIPLVNIFRLYILALIGLSVCCARAIFKSLFQSPARFRLMLTQIMSYGLACTLLFIPADAFGQREHLFVMLTFPYVLLAACRLDNLPVRRTFAILVGIMAGVGFAIKPFFLPSLCLIELWFVVSRKSILGWVRAESLIAVVMILVYGLSVLVFYPDYLHVVLPLWMPYYRGIITSWIVVLSYPGFIFGCAALVLYGCICREKQNASLKIVLCLAIAGDLITYLMPRAVWYYHILPVISVACMFILLVLAELMTQTIAFSKSIMPRAFIIVLAAMVFFIPAYQGIELTKNSIKYFHADSDVRRLLGFLKNHPADNSYDFLSMTHQLSVLELYSSARFVGSFEFCSWEYMRLAPEKYSIAYQQDKLSYVLNVKSRDLNEKKPQFVIVEGVSAKAYLGQNIDYLKEYSRDSQFREAWSHYRLVERIAPFDIYQRIS